MRFFNVAGPVRPDKHYAIQPLDRVDVDELLTLIRAERYFALHAPRQTGKTSAFIALRDFPNSGEAGDFRCVNVNVEPAQVARDDVVRGVRAVHRRLHQSIRSPAGAPDRRAQRRDRRRRGQGRRELYRDRPPLRAQPTEERGDRRRGEEGEPVNGDWDVDPGLHRRAKRWLWSGATACAAGAVVNIAALALGSPSGWTLAIMGVFWAVALCFAWVAVRYLLRARARGS